MYNFLFTWHVAHFLQKCKQEKNILHIHNYDKVKKFEYKNEKRLLRNKVTKTHATWEFLFYTHIHPSMVNIWQNLSLLPVARVKVKVHKWNTLARSHFISGLESWVLKLTFLNLKWWWKVFVMKFSKPNQRNLLICRPIQPFWSFCTALGSSNYEGACWILK